MKKILNIYPNELIYSSIARFGRHHGISRVDFLHNELFDQLTNPIYDLPNRCMKLLQNTTLDMYLNENELISNHTLYSFYAAFLDQSDREQLFERMMNSNQPTHQWNRIYYFKAIDQLKRLRFCPECVRSDTEEYGEPYWHVIHQVPGVVICPEHQISLQTTCCECGATFTKKPKSFVALNECCPIGHDLTFRSKKRNMDHEMHRITYAHDVAMILDRKIHLPPDQLRKIYVSKLSAFGLVSRHGNIRKRELTYFFIDYFGKDYLDSMESSLDVRDTFNWLSVALRNVETRLHPLRHLLLIHFLFGSLANLLDYIDYMECFSC